MQRAEQVASAPADRAFAQHYLGELAWDTGDLDGAAAAYAAALATDPTHVPALAGRAKVEAARGDVDGAVADYRAAVARQPQPGTLVELGRAARGDRAHATRRSSSTRCVRATQQLYAAGGQVVDAELALFEADHGDPALGRRAGASRRTTARPDSIVVQDAYALGAARRRPRRRGAAARPGRRRAPGCGRRRSRYHLGVVEAAAGNERQARAALQRALDAQPGLQPAARARGARPARRAVVRRSGAARLVVAGLAGGLLVGAAPAASAHPLGNFTVNTADRVLVGGDDVRVLHAVDLAEIPTLQLAQGPDAPDADRDGTLRRGASCTSWAAAECGRTAPQLSLVLDGAPAALEVAASGARRVEGAAGLATLRLDCAFTADAVPRLDGRVRGPQRGRPYGLEGGLGHRALRVGAAATSLQDSPSALLEAYPSDLLSSPLAVTSAVVLGRGAAGPAAPTRSVPGSSVLPARRRPADLGVLLVRLAARS